MKNRKIDGRSVLLPGVPGGFSLPIPDRPRCPTPKLPDGYRVRVDEDGCRQLEKETVEGWVCVVAEINPTLFRNPYSTLLLADLQAIAAFLQGAR